MLNLEEEKNGCKSAGNSAFNVEIAIASRLVIANLTLKACRQLTGSHFTLKSQLPVDW